MDQSWNLAIERMGVILGRSAVLLRPLHPIALGRVTNVNET